MTSSKFIKQEKVFRTNDLIRLNLRLFRSLPLFLVLLPFTVVFVLLASAAPSFFRWYAAKYTSNIAAQFTLEGLFWVAVLAALFRVTAWIFFEVSAMWSSQSLFSEMIQALSKTRTTFFDENPSARIMNRLIRDYDELRSTAIIFAGDFLNATIEVIGISVVASFASPWAMAMVIPLLSSFFFIQYQRSAMIEHCRTLSAIANSHVLNRKNDLIEGRDIYLIYGKAEHLLERMKQSLRTYLQASLLTFQVDIWASFWIRFFAECFSLIVLLFTIGALHRNQIDIPLAGVIISALFGITGSIGWLDFSSSMVSRSAPHLQRVFEFIDLPPETTEEFSIKTNCQPSTLPSTKKNKVPGGYLHGDITFKDYTMSYREGLPLILQNLNLVIRQNSKTALMGRTGSGKSSLIQALLRMVHVQQGDIFIGEQSIFQMDLQNLRLNFGVVPQSPYLFEGTVASNLDRTGVILPLNLKTSMEAVGLSIPLDHPIIEGGQNLSIGERQLICLARVIANDRPIILMDEPTSGLDPETDARISWILKSALKNKTVITIAHRHESIKNYERVIRFPTQGK